MQRTSQSRLYAFIISAIAKFARKNAAIRYKIKLTSAFLPEKTFIKTYTIIPKPMPSEREYVRTIKRIIAKAEKVTVLSLQSISLRLEKSVAPTATKASEVTGV